LGRGDLGRRIRESRDAWARCFIEGGRRSTPRKTLKKRDRTGETEGIKVGGQIWIQKGGAKRAIEFLQAERGRGVKNARSLVE